MTPSRRLVLGGGAGLAAALGLRPATTVAGELDEAAVAAIDQAISAAIAAGACSGVQIAMALRGRPLLSKGFGLANLETRTSVTADTVFRIGSLTKQFTAAAIVKLSASGRLGLDDPASRHLPFFATHKPFTLRELMNHTAGLHSDDQAVSCPAGAAGQRSQIDLARAIGAQGKVFDFDPGTAWFYSNANYIVLGAVIEQVTGSTLAAAVARMIFKPLGLVATAFDTSGAIVPGRASGYTPVDGAPPALRHSDFIEISDAGGAGAMRSTALDLCRWHAALFSGRLFDPAHVEMMLTPGRLRDGRLSGSHRFSPDDAAYGDVQYALGLLVAPPIHGHRSALHYGAIDGFAACLETYVDVGLTCAVLCNGDIGPAAPFKAVRRVLAERVLTHPN